MARKRRNEILLHTDLGYHDRGWRTGNFTIRTRGLAPRKRQWSVQEGSRISVGNTLADLDDAHMVVSADAKRQGRQDLTVQYPGTVGKIHRGRKE